MKVSYGLDNFKTLKNAVVTSGTFDGVHKGHQVILSRLKEIAQREKGETVVLTFWPHPRYVLNPESDFKLLSTIDEKIELLRKHEIDHMVIIPFTVEFSRLSSREFIQQVLSGIIGTKSLVIGYDHKFGRNQEGSFDYLMQNPNQFQFKVEEIPRHEVDEVGISSTKIREALHSGDIQTANRYLGYNYSLTGRVGIGQQLGRKIGFPTANLEVSDINKLIPSDGVYAIRAHIEQENLEGMMNIGYRPTVQGEAKTIEANLFNFDSEIYRKIIRIEIIEKIREEQKFNTIDELQEQLAKDKTKALQILKKP